MDNGPSQHQQSQNQPHQQRRKLYQTQMCTLTLVETAWLADDTTEMRRQRNRRSLAASSRSSFSVIEFTDESGNNVTATDEYFGDDVNNEGDDDGIFNVSDIYFDDNDEIGFDMAGSRATEEWQCLLDEADAVASGVDYVAIHGLSNEFFKSEGVISGETKMAVPTAIIEDAALKVPQDAEVTLENTMPPEEEEEVTTGVILLEGNDGSSKSSKSDRRLRQRNSINKDGRRRLNTSATGTKKMLVIRVIANDATTTPSASKLTNDVFQDDNCLKSQYKRCSYNQLDFVQGTGKSVNGGVVNIRLNKNVKGRDKDVVQQEVQNAAKDHFGVINWKDDYDHVMICLPPGTNGNWIAYAYVSSWLSIYNDKMCSSMSAQMHEVGHNLGLAHSGESGQYDDQSGMFFVFVPCFCFILLNQLVC